MKYLTLLFLVLSSTCFSQQDSVTLRIKTIEKRTGYKLDSVWAIFTSKNEKDSFVVYSDTSGWINIKLKKKPYRLFFGKNTYYGQCPLSSDNFYYDKTFLDLPSDTIFTVTIERIIVAFNIRIEDIFFDYKKSFIRPDAAIELKKFATILNSCKSMKWEVSTYSDCRELKKFNNKLNALRSKSILAFLIERGVTQEQLTFVNKPIVYNTHCDCSQACTEIEHQDNRLASFKILSY